ncbi:uncharacterized protein SCHCODRAFT_02570352 [Schizophyllum commune H4-8]|uniref:F-box domain-containing protein n=1 Tax=Schizophyllum commune (strain H4-8 / FGSC 9210) TaxID=578458 RepID=D8PXQ1_SCHCM|nr:uncharacterized protein SCHCODRAFT_02570352 [Schizophyllum commune H4-8]KAI5897002.1 hypothetical protein SCHCODRAFT_02570352 [Schizophyllum commune H4-8]
MGQHTYQRSPPAFPTFSYVPQHNALGLVFAPPEDCLAQQPRGEVLSHLSWKRSRQSSTGSAVSVINKLPAELLSLIFALSVEDEACNLALAVLHPNCTPLVLARVCHLWRETAVELPSLWQHFMLRPCDGREHHYRMAHTFIKRTKGSGLHIRYSEDVRSEESRRPVESCPCSLNVILDNLGSIKTLELSEVGKKTSTRLSDAAMKAGTSIQRFSLSMEETVLHLDTAQAISRLYCSPALRHFEWDSHIFPCNVPWSHMLSVDLNRCLVAPVYFVNILVSAPHLRELSVKMARLSPMKHLGVRHDSLRRLSIDGMGAQDNILDFLHAPNLTELSLQPLRSLPDGACYAQWPVTTPDVLFDFLGRLSGGLESFRLIDTGNLDELALLHLFSLPQMSTLRRLHLSARAAVAGDQLFHFMLPSQWSGVPTLLPRLENLTLAGCTTTDGMISDMLRARQYLHYPLHLVWLGFPRNDQPEVAHRTDIAAFRKLKQYGMEVSWYPSRFPEATVYIG